MTGLDGLRGIAVLAVILYHLDIGIFPGGFLGVDIFFVLSGFLITSILIQEIEQTGRIDRAQFYIRRIRRLMPALFLMLIFSVIAVGIWAQDAAYPVRRDLPWALTFVLNWSYIFFDQSYFVNISRPPMLQHLWSLAIEEQFYVIWPVILILLTKTRLNMLGIRALISLIASTGAITSSIWMAYLSIKNGYPTPNDPSRVYFGADTHSMGLLIGCATAAFWKSEKLNPKITPDHRNLLNLLSLAAIAVIGYFIFKISEFDTELYIYGFTVVSLASAIVVYLATHPGLRLGYLLSFKPLVWLGERSYGIYIWHWPIYMLLRPGIDVSWPDSVTTVVRLGLVLIISNLSYRFIELPIRKGAIGRLIKIWQINGIPKPSFAKATTAAAAVALVLTSTIGMYRAPVANAENLLGLGGITSIDQDPTLAPLEPTISIPTGSDAQAPTKDQIINAKNSLVVFGDSVVLSGLEPIKAALGDIAIDAEVGRQPSEIAQRIELRRKERRLGNDVVIHMGTNGVISRGDLEPILQELSDRHRVVLINVKVPRNWMAASNAMINELIPLYPNVRLADWAATADGQRSFFGPDGVHLTKTGGEAFAALIKATLDAP